MLNGSPHSFYGLTSWDSYGQIAEEVAKNLPSESYIVPSIHYAFHALATNLWGYEYLQNYAAFADFCLISYVAMISSEIIAHINLGFDAPRTVYLNKYYWPLTAYTLFLSSPLTYRMMLASWPEVAWVACILTSYLLSIKKKRIAALSLVFLAGLFHWIWSVILSSFYITLILFGLCSSHPTILRKYLPPAFRTFKQACLFACGGLLPAITYNLQLYLLNSRYSVSSTGSSILKRIGIDSIDNINHGGILATLQFLGGNRLSVCFQGATEGINQSIYRFNCITSISSWTFISLVALLSSAYACFRFRNLCWIIIPIGWSFVTFSLVFQQSTAVHIHGHSFVIVFLIVFGIIFLLRLLAGRLQLSNFAIFISSISITSGLVINALRVSYLTGQNG